jgi:uncharacterized protein
VRRVYVDSGVFFAQIVREDRFHDRARFLFAQANRERWRLVTTNAVVFESFALLLNRSTPGRNNALAFLDLVESDAYQIERIRKADEKGASALVRAHADKTYSLCDALSFVTMERLGISEAIAFDDDFRSYGRFTILQ